MKILIVFVLILFISSLAFAQQTASDTWSNVPKSQDDRYINPKSAVYAGPNGWWNFGETKAEGRTDATVKYAFKGGLNTNSDVFILVESGKLQSLSMDFGTSEPTPGIYQISKEANLAQKKVAISFSDVANKKIKEWSGTEGSGSVAVSLVHGFIYFKFRNVVLQPSAMYNEGNFKQPLKIGFEGAVKP